MIHVLNPYHDDEQIFEEVEDLKLMEEENKILKRQEWIYEHSHSDISQNSI